MVTRLAVTIVVIPAPLFVDAAPMLGGLLDPPV